MNPSRELDALVAEKVMVWSHEKDAIWRDRCDGKFKTRCGSCGAFGHGNCYGNGEGAVQIECDCVPSYSSDISAAWEVFEKFKACARIEKTFSEDNLDGYWCELSLEVGEGVASWTGVTAPHAICLAALKAVGVEV